MVEESKNDDNTIIELTEAKMEELKLMRGDQVLLRGKLIYTNFWTAKYLNNRVTFR